jgi:ribonuclease HI
MVFHVYVDGSGPPKSRYGYFVEETMEYSVKSLDGMTNNEAEYRAIIDVLTNAKLPKDQEIIIYSDSQTVVGQIRHDFGINEDRLRDLAMKVWDLIKDYNPRPKFEWISRKQNKAGKMLGS